MKIKKEECTAKKHVDNIENADVCVSPTYKILLGDKVSDFTCPTKCSPDTTLNEKLKNSFSVSNNNQIEGNSVMWPPPSGILRQALLSFSVPTEKPELNDPPSGILRQALMSFSPSGDKIIENEQESSECKKLSAILNSKTELKRDVPCSPLLSSLINDNTKNLNFYSNNSHLNNNVAMTTTSSDNLSILSLPLVSFPNTSVIPNSAVIAVSSSIASLACEPNHVNKIMIPQLSSQIVSCCSNIPTQSSPVYTHSKRNEINMNGMYPTKPSHGNIPELKLSKSISSFVSSPPREANVTVVFSTVDNKRKLVDSFTNGSSLHPPPISKSKSSHLDTETELNVSKLEDLSENNVLSNITPILATQNSLNLSEKLNDLNTSAISCDINSIKLDDHQEHQDEAIDFSSNALISLPENSMRFHNENSCSNLGSGILIPVSSSIILNKVDFSSHSSDDIEHIIIPNSLYGSHINTAVTSNLSVTSKGSLQDSTLLGTGSPMSSMVSTESNLSLATWHNHTIPISKVSTSDSIVTQSSETSFGNASSTINIVETSSLSTSTTNSTLQITGIGSTATCGSLSPKTTSPVFTISSSGSSSMDGNPYSLQSPAEILSQLSKAGVLPTMSSSQVSSVLSALGADTHLDIDTENGHPSENISNQILPLPLTGEKVSTPTQTDCVDLPHSVEVECIDTDEKSLSQHQAPNDDSIIVQQVMNMFNQHSDNSSITVASKSPTLTSFVDSTSNNHTAITTNTGTSSSVKGAPYPKIVAMVLNTSGANVNKSPLSSPESLNIGGTIEGVILHSSNDVKVDQRTAVLPISSVFIKQEEYEGLSKSRAVNSETSNEPALQCTNDKQKRGVGLRKNSLNSPSPIVKSKGDKTTKKNAHKEINYSEESIKFVEQVSCYKCKFCSFINLQKSLVSSHIEHEHKSEIVSASDSCRLKCVGCSRLFCGTTALSTHLVNEHNISEEEVKNIVTMAVKSLVDEDLSKSKSRNKKKKGKNVQKDAAVLLTESKDTKSLNNNQDVVPNIATLETSKIRVKNLESQITVVTNILSQKESENKVTESSVAVDEGVSSGNVNVREDSLVIDFDPLVSQKQVNGTDMCQYRVVKSDNSDIIMIYEDNSVFAEESKKEVPAQIVKKRGRPKGSRNEPPVKSNINAEKEQGYKCNIDNCAVRLRSHDNIEYHRRCHSHSGAQYVCPECSLIHCHWNGMSTHLWRVHLINMELFSCDQCSYKTTSYSKLVNLHKRIHGTERPFLCDTCGKGFKNQKQLRNHKVIHDTNTKSKPTMPGECELCGRTFSNMRKLRLHTDNVHRKIRPHLCSYCGYSASSISTLKMHMRQHTGEKPFNCSECEYRTSDHNSLRRHKMRHTGAKPYKCPHCDYACIQSSTYKAHLKTKHPGLDNGLMFSCNECSFRSVKEENYLAHLGQHKIGGIPQPKKRKKISDVQNEETEETTFDVEFGSESVAHLVEPLLIEDPEDPGNELTSFSVSNMESVTEIQLSSEFEAEEITGDIHEPQELKFKIREDIKP